MDLYQLVVSLIGEVPTEFTFIYSVLTTALALMLFGVLSTLFYIPINIVRRCL